MCCVISRNAYNYLEITSKFERFNPVLYRAYSMTRGPGALALLPFPLSDRNRLGLYLTAM